MDRPRTLDATCVCTVTKPEGTDAVTTGGVPQGGGP